MSSIPELSDVLTLRTLSQFASDGETDTVPAALMDEPLQPELIVKGIAIVNIRMSYGTNKLVVFSPTLATRQSVKAYEGKDVALVLEDKNGTFTPMSAQVITGSVYEPGNNTMVIDTENQA